MKREISVLAIFVGLIAVAMVFSGCGKKTAVPAEQTSARQSESTAQLKEGEAVSKPWVEVVVDGAFIVLDENKKQALKTGDELNEGELIETDKNGLANIYFPDGSVARMDSNTKIQIKIGQYDNSTKSLKVKIALVAGNVWSKIIKLATPESVWEVETSNAVAAVRGSAFGTSQIAKKTTIIGSEHTVVVSPINQASGSPMPNQEASVSEKEILVISFEELASYMTGNTKIGDNVRQATNSDYLAKWITESLKADNLINQRLLSLQSEGLSEEEARFRYSQELLKNFSPKTRIDSPVIEVETSKIQEDAVLVKPVQRQEAVEKPALLNTTDSETPTNDPVEETGENDVLSGENNQPLNQATSSEPADTEDTWSDIPVATGTSPNLGSFFIDETSTN